MKKNLWSPAAVGRDFDLSPSSLTPLEPLPRAPDHRQQHRRAQRRGVRAAGDRRRPLPLERGVPDPGHPKQTQGSDVQAGTSLDQLYAQRFGQDTPIPSMQLCIESVDQAGGCAYGYSCVYTDTISWASPTEPLPMIRDPRAAFDQLFGVGATAEERAAAAQRDKSILDLDRRRGRAAAPRSRRGRPRPARRLPRRRARDRAPHPEGRGAQLERRGARAARGADRRARRLRRARQADVRPAGAGVRQPTSPASSPSRWAATARAASTRPAASTPASTRRRTTTTARIASATSQKINTYHVSLLPYFLEQAEEHARRRRHPARQHAGHLRLADGQLERAQPQALPAVLRRPRRRQAEGRPAHQGRRRHADGQRRSSARCTSSGLDDLKTFGDSTGALDLNAAPETRRPRQ